MGPQLQAAGADAEHAGEKLSRVKEGRDVKVLRQVWKLFAEISRLLQDRKCRNRFHIYIPSWRTVESNFMDNMVTQNISVQKYKN